MTDYTYAVEFHMDGCGFNGLMFRLMIRSEFVMLYNAFCEEVNPMLEIWNKEYDTPDQIFQYERFIYEKMLPIAKKLRSRWLEGDIDRESCTFIARMKGRPDSKIYVTLKER